MAARSKSSEAKTVATSGRRKTAAAGARASVAKKPTLATVQKECDQLKDQLKVSEARVSELEGLLDEALNRIDWAIDSLQDAAVNKT